VSGRRPGDYELEDSDSWSGAVYRCSPFTCVAIVEQALEREVKAFMRQVDLSRDLAIELFLADSGTPAHPGALRHE
jgi:hypothetical protein